MSSRRRILNPSNSQQQQRRTSFGDSQPPARVLKNRAAPTNSPSRRRGGDVALSLFPGVQPSESFERMSLPSSSSRVPPENRFDPRHEPLNYTSTSSTSFEDEEEFKPQDGALQFVPSFEEPPRRRGASWDAILDDEEKKESSVAELPARAREYRQRKSPTTTAVQTTSSSNARSASVGSARQMEQSFDPFGDEEEESNDAALRFSNPRMTRIKSLFSSRATVRSADSRKSASPARSGGHLRNDRQTSSPGRRGHVRHGSEPDRKKASPVRGGGQFRPTSPSNSTSSSGYVGWPGTQDKRGATVALQSSYDDSSAGPAEPMKEAAARELCRWTRSPKRSEHGRKSFSSEAARSTSSSGEDGTWSPQRSEGHVRRKSFQAEERMRSASGENGRVRKSSQERPERVGRSRSASSSDGLVENNTDYHLRAALEDARAVVARTSSGTSRYAKSDVGKNLPAPNRLGARRDTARWKQSDSSSGGTSASKTSSAYLNQDEMAKLFNGASNYSPYGDEEDDKAGMHGVDNKQEGASSFSEGSHVPTEENLAASDHFTPPHRSFPTAKGYRGLIDKTQDVPSLMDAMDSDSMSSKATSTFSSGPSHVGARKHSQNNSETESDVFDGISFTKESDVFDNLSSGTSPARRSGKTPRASYPERIAEEEEVNEADFSVVLLGGGLAAIQSTQMGFSNRNTASDFDDNLTNSETDPNGFARVPGFNQMLSAGKDKDSSLHGIHGNFNNSPSKSKAVALSTSEELTESDDASSLFTDPYDQEFEGNSYLDVGGDLSEYYVQPRLMKKLVRRYRDLSESIDGRMSLAEFEREEDEHKAFALVEMRSRIMEKDIERGLERRGGTVVVDDIVTTPYNRTAHRIRDAVIVSKAWRDGASPSDVINTALLTRRAEHTYFIKRPISSFVGDSLASRRFPWEAVKWVDDTDFMLYRCPSLGPRHMHGFEMFTVGDCQSILLKLTNEQCLNLRTELNEATRLQIEAEDLLRQEGDNGDGMMTEAEMTYLSAMEEVKTISKKLVVAEQAFALVHDRIQELVTRYQQLLVKIETESFDRASSVVTYESSYYSEHDSATWEEFESREKAMWARRARRAEVRAELAAREALMAKQEARMIKEEKQRELEALQQKLSELQSEPSTAVTEKEQSAAIAQTYTVRRNEDSFSEALERGPSNKEKIDGVKRRFRERIAAKKAAATTTPSTPVQHRSQNNVALAKQTPSPPSARSLFRSAGEEMYSHLDFYERSLKAIEMSREDKM